LWRVGAEPQAGEDLVPHDRRRSGGAGHHACIGQVRDEVAQLQVVGAEVVSPFRDAVRLVDGHERTVDLAHERAEAREGEALRGDIGDLELAAGQRRHAPADLLAVQRGRQEGGVDAARGECGDLIVHERDQRRHDEGGPLEHGRRELVDQRLPAAGGGDQEEAPLIDDGLDGLALAGAKGVVAEAAEGGVEIGERCGRGVGHRPQVHESSQCLATIRVHISTKSRRCEVARGAPSLPQRRR
jgi:hypothetical protein